MTLNRLSNNCLNSVLCFLNIQEIAGCGRVCKKIRTQRDSAIQTVLRQSPVDNESLANLTYYLYSCNCGAFRRNIDLPTRLQLKECTAVRKWEWPISGKTAYAFIAVSACASNQPEEEIRSEAIPRVTAYVRSFLEPIRHLSISNEAHLPPISVLFTMDLLRFMPNLTSLSMTLERSNSPKLLPEHFHTLAKATPRLVNLVLQVEDFLPREHLQAIGSCTQLKELSIVTCSRVELQPNDVESLVDHLPLLETISIVRRSPGHEGRHPLFALQQRMFGGPIPDNLIPSPAHWAANERLRQKRPKPQINSLL